MRVELLTVSECRDAPRAAQLLRRALDDIGQRDTGFTTRVITDEAEATRVGFTGSPTFLINGRDPFAPPVAVAGLTCRLSLPDFDDLRCALLAEAQLEH